MEWIYHQPSFEYEQYPISIKHLSAWTGHCNFAYDLVRFLKPKRIVELGSYYGTSFFSFCQAVKDEALATTCYAVDTWKGDPQSGYYNNQVFELVKKIRTEYYLDISELIPKTFDQAVMMFEDSTIDVLHIDGYHTFEAVSHDYLTWLPKLSDQGVILFHDISVKVNGFGVYLLWEKLKQLYPSIEFKHSYGLGVLFPKGIKEHYNQMFEKSAEMQKIYIE